MGSTTRRFLFLILAFALAAGPIAIETPAMAQDRAAMAIKRNDKDRDGKISRKEWKRSADIFSEIDTDGDGFLTLEEFRARFAGGGMGKGGKMGGDGNRISVRMLDQTTMQAFIGSRAVLSVEEARGQVESTLIPVYPDTARCYKIDHIFGEKWKGPLPNKKHSGADIPAPWNEPIHAMADGVVVGLFKGESGYRGLQIILRHTPEETGLPVYVYTLYSHFRKMPELKVGQQVHQGDYLGPNGKTGVPAKDRQPHLHLSVYYSESPRYAVTPDFLVPENGYFIDPVALFRGKMPLETHALRALPKSEKRVKIAYTTTSGERFPKDAKIVWPYKCKPR